MESVHETLFSRVADWQPSVMQDKLTLMIPGPTPVPESVLKAMGRHPIGHRSGDFQAVVKRTTEQLKWLHQTDGDVLVITGSGTAAMEAGIINTLSRGDKVLCGDNGKFGERWVKVAKAFGLDVQVISAEWGQPLNPEDFRDALNADTDKAIKAVILTHSETSTGVINDLQSISGHVRAHGTAITIADCVTSLGATDVPMDAWGVDVVASGSQKGYMLPPGLSFVAMGERAWQAYERSDLPKFYLDLGAYRKTAAKNSNPFTPAVNLYFALEVALEMMQKEGLEAIFARHSRHRAATQAGICELLCPSQTKSVHWSTVSMEILTASLQQVDQSKPKSRENRRERAVLHVLEQKSGSDTFGFDAIAPTGIVGPLLQSCGCHALMEHGNDVYFQG